ncbi:hypothetical protein SNE40_013936 [Patella caerulea]|uniref:Chitin-binding type-4 domain-containing protein n=1 Tax=Patella caerulea TaxID=87958 RepID=A0AAN8JDJ7_PATCE
MGLNCGGLTNQVSNGGKCGICGDSYNGPRRHEPGAAGIYAQGIITGCYSDSDTIDVTVHLTMNHMGWMEWRLCPHNEVTTTVTQACLDRNLLQIVGEGDSNWYKDGETRLKISSVDSKSDDYFKVSLAIPDGVKCDGCVLQWIYKSGNNWGCEIVDGSEICNMGLGPEQEEFRNCADIAILDVCPDDVLDLPMNNPGSHHAYDEISSTQSNEGHSILHLSEVPEVMHQHETSFSHLHQAMHEHDHEAPESDVDNNEKVADEKQNLLQALSQQINSFMPLAAHHPLPLTQGDNLDNEADEHDTLDDAQNIPRVDGSPHNTPDDFVQTLIDLSQVDPVGELSQHASNPPDSQHNDVVGQQVPTDFTGATEVIQQPLIPPQATQPDTSLLHNTHRHSLHVADAPGVEIIAVPLSSHNQGGSLGAKPVSLLIAKHPRTQPQVAQTASGYCSLQLDLGSNAKLEKFCLDRNCQVDFASRKCHCF